MLEQEIINIEAEKLNEIQLSEMHPPHLEKTGTNFSIFSSKKIGNFQARRAVIFIILFN